MSKFIAALDNHDRFTIAINKSMVKELSIDKYNAVIATMTDGSTYRLFSCDDTHGATCCLQDAIIELDDEDSDCEVDIYREEAK